MINKKKIFVALRFIFGALFVVVLIIVFLLVKDDYKALPSKDFVDFQTEEITKNNRNYLLISGEYYGSALKIRKVKDKVKNGDIVVSVYTTLFSKNDSSFLHVVELNSSVNRVLFGNDEKMIWQRR